MRKPAEIPRDVFFGEAPAAEGAGAPLRSARTTDDNKLQVTVYLSEAMAKKLEAVRYHLLSEHNVKVSKSAIAEYALSQIPDDLTPLARFFAAGER